MADTMTASQATCTSISQGCASTNRSVSAQSAVSPNVSAIRKKNGSIGSVPGDFA